MLSLSKVIEENLLSEGLSLIRYNHIVLQLSKCLKSEAVGGGGGGAHNLNLRYNKTRG